MPAYPLSKLSSNASGSVTATKRQQQNIPNSSCSEPQALNTTSTRTSPRLTLKDKALPGSPVTPSASNTMSMVGLGRLGSQARGGSPNVNVTATPGNPAVASSKKPVPVVAKERSSSRHKVCPHGTRQTRCPTCLQGKVGGRSLCLHGRQRGWCAQCKRDHGSVYYYDMRAQAKLKNAKKRK